MAAKKARTGRQQLVRAAKVVVFVGLLVALGFSVRSQWGTVGRDLRRLPAGDAVAALLLSFVATAVSMQAWRTILADLDPGFRSRRPFTSTP